MDCLNRIGPGSWRRTRSYAPMRDCVAPAVSGDRFLASVGGQFVGRTLSGVGGATEEVRELPTAPDTATTRQTFP